MLLKYFAALTAPREADLPPAARATQLRSPDRPDIAGNGERREARPRPWRNRRVVRVAMTTAPGRARQEQIYRDGVAAPAHASPPARTSWARRGQRALNRRDADRGRAGTTLRANQGRSPAGDRAADLRDVAARDLSVELFGRQLPARCCSPRSAPSTWSGAAPTPRWPRPRRPASRR
ncbi:hypothetical protein HBB16_15075 [Pseudonocardia sp. MCCB 268]|nr:hypothetical protein [Pseudonocardia cytotoxica]